MSEFAIEMINITKRFVGLTANDNITLKVKKGEIHSLLGENGAGKSTLMSILFGLYQADHGYIKVDGKILPISNPNHATAAGIGMVHQHFKLVSSYTVTQNIILGLEPTDNLGHIKYKEARKKVAQLSHQYGLDIDPDAVVQDISVGMQQRVEIIKTLYRNANIIVLDEPSAVLTPQEIEQLLQIIKKLQSEGKTIILITHKLKEIKAVAQSVSVIRRGKLIETVDVEGCDEQKLAEMMVGRPVKLSIEKTKAKPGEEIIKIENLCVRDGRGVLVLNKVNLTVHQGEIMGIAGVDGNGQRELVLALYGLIPIESGKIYYKGRDITHCSVKERIEKGMALGPEDRQLQGVIMNFRLDENAILKTYNKAPFKSKLGLLNFEKMKQNAETLIAMYDVRSARGYLSKMGDLSGGNQQKMLLAREMESHCALLTICQPTRGLDVGSIEYIHKQIVIQRDRNVAVLLISFELDEVMSLCDKIATISHGEIIDVIEADGADSLEIGAMMAGLKRTQQG